jgi:hypothetical protein
MNVSEDALRTVVAHLARMREGWSAVLDEAELVEPTGTYFPDAFALEPEAVERLMRRMMTYAPLAADLEVALAFVEPDTSNEAGGASGTKSGGGCSSGGCGTGGGGGAAPIPGGGAVETDEGYAVALATTDVGDPTLLTTSLGRSMGRLVLHECGEAVEPRDEAAMAELTAVACGFGVLLLNGACLYKKGCGGMRMHQGTVLDVHEIALATALFVRVHDKKAGAVRRHLEVTQREAFDEALAWVDTQPKLVTNLRAHPERLRDGIFVAEEKKGLFAKLFDRKKDDELPAAEDFRKTPARAARVLSDDERRRLAETRALVDEALQES